jgi:hypothetical protein
MPRDYNINISIGGGGNARGSFRGGNVYKTKSTLNSKGFGDYGQTDINLKRVVNIGLGFNLAQKGNELVGAYTENRLRQKKFNVGMTFAKYGIGLAVNAPVGITYAVGDLGYRTIGYGITLQKQNKEARYYQKLSGNDAASGRRYRGDYV